MAYSEPDSFDHYGQMLTARTASWRPSQRLAFVAAMAERWLPTYRIFAETMEWGDSDALQATLEAIWGLIGGAAGRVDWDRVREEVDGHTPHLDDFDMEEAWPALHVCVLLGYAIDACASGGPANTTQAAMDGLQARLPDYPLDESLREGPRTAGNDRRYWRRAAVQEEVSQQRRLLEEIDSWGKESREEVSRLRSSLEQLAPRAPKPRKRKPKAPATRSNEMAFNDYRRTMEEQIQRRFPHSRFLDAGDAAIMEAWMAWLSRYVSRYQCIEGKSRQPLADQKGRDALIARYRHRDARVAALPSWAESTQGVMVRMGLQNNQRMGTCDVSSLEALHGYGPSLRALWADAEKVGLSGAQAWQRIRDWGLHRPAAWGAPNQPPGRDRASPELTNSLGQPLHWRSSDDRECPWEATYEGRRWRIRINDFPDEIMYTLLIDRENVGDFHDWPPTWQRP